MELYTLDPLLRREEVVDSFESLIWTERFNKAGDFKLTIRSTADTRRVFKTGLLLACNKSHRIMAVEGVENSADAEGRRILEVTGPSIEQLMDDRVARANWAGLTATPTWNLTGFPAVIMRKIFHDVCVVGVLDTSDVLPFINEGNVLFPVSNISEPSTSISLPLEPTTVLQALGDLGGLYDLGFRLVRNYDLSQLYFDVYAGADRTTGQTFYPAVVFSAQLDNLQNTTEYTTTSGAKNMAYVFSPVGYQVVLADGVDENVEGFERRVLLVKADDINDTDTTVATNRMIQRGKEELAKARTLQAFDGEINQNSSYKYMVDYNLGDMVEVQNADGVANKMRVTEQIIVQDREGERSYPTLALNSFITVGSWVAWTSNKRWIDYDADTTTTWSTLP